MNFSTVSSLSMPAVPGESDRVLLPDGLSVLGKAMTTGSRMSVSLVC